LKEINWLRKEYYHSQGWDRQKTTQSYIGSVIVNRCDIALNESTTLKHTIKRLYRNIKRPGLDSVLRQQLMQIQCRCLDEETLIIVDESDIVKPEVKKMEGLNKVYDSSTGKHDQSGYMLLNFIGYQEQGNSYRIIPLSTDLYSDSVEVDSLSNIIHDRIDDIALYSNHESIFVFDRGFGSRTNLDHLVNNGNSFIIRGVGKRNLIIEGEERSFKEVCRTIRQDYQVQGNTKDQYFRCGIQRIRVRTVTIHRKSCKC